MAQKDQIAWRIAVIMEIHAACSTKTKAKAEEIEKELSPIFTTLTAARQQLKTLGTPDDAINNAVLDECDKALAMAGTATIGPDLTAAVFFAAPAMLSELRAVLTFLEDEIIQGARPIVWASDSSFGAEARKRADSIAAIIKAAMGES